MIYAIARSSQSLKPNSVLKCKVKGLIRRGWAPQVLILEHQAIGAFFTHCGWNSILEGVSAGVSLITCRAGTSPRAVAWEGFGTGVSFGAQQWAEFLEVKKKAQCEEGSLEKVVTQVMVRGEAKEMRSRGRALGEMARRAVEEGDSSFSDLTALVEELMSLRG
ncbi:unnamed protein product [Prunus armeniaca]|uniref:Uncharacterized protein n=1 Tax=Prunus armeniaca TaxID=36596 RepID=A0A6J5VS37_PRUAR|nr:unnamed protein product [Prunus armeniaca]